MMQSMRSLYIELFIGVICVMETMALICPYDECKCQYCEEAGVSCQRLSEVPPLRTGRRVFKVNTLSFTGGSITTITKSSLPADLTLINLQGHPLTNISADAFDKSAETLERLFIRQASFTSLPKALKNLTRLTDLTIQDTTIEEWDTATLAQIGTSLQLLELMNVGLSSWPDWISDFHLLHTLILSKNSLHSIPDNAFSSIKDSLKVLHLSKTGLIPLPQALSTLSRLNFLDLSGNNFTDASEFRKVTESAFAQRLVSLFLLSAGLTTMPNLSNLTSLKSLLLSDNRIANIPVGSLPESLTFLQLLNNRLSYVPKDIAIMHILTDLSMDFNLISVIEPNSFPLSLRSLSLRYNHITVINKTTFGDLRLNTLHLNGNPIRVISADAFSNLTLLRHLEIKDTQMTEFPLAFTQLPRETCIYFSTPHAFSCPCPSPQQLVERFMSIRNRWHVEGICTDRKHIKLYLSGQCEQA